MPDQPTTTTKPADNTQTQRPNDQTQTPTQAQNDTTHKPGDQQQQQATTTDTSGQHLPDAQVKPLSDSDVTKRKDDLNNLLKEDHPDAEKLQNLLTGIPEEQRKKIVPDNFEDTIKNKYSSDHDDTRLEQAKILDVYRKPDDRANFAGDIHVFLVNPDKGQTNTQLIDYLSTLTPEQMKTADADYQKQYGQSLHDAFTKESDNREQDFGNRMPDWFKKGEDGKSSPLDLLLKGKGDGGRTAEDNVALANAGAKAGDTAGMSLIAGALGGDTDAAKKARQQLCPDGDLSKLDPTLKSAIEKSWDGDKRSMVEDMVSSGSTLRFVLGEKGTTPAQVTQALTTATEAERNQFRQGALLSAQNKPESQLTTDEKKALDFYKNVDNQLKNVQNEANKPAESDSGEHVVKEADTPLNGDTKPTDADNLKQRFTWENQLALCITGGSLASGVINSSQDLSTMNMSMAIAMQKLTPEQFKELQGQSADMQSILKSQLGQLNAPGQDKALELLNQRLTSPDLDAAKSIQLSFADSIKFDNSPSNVVSSIQNLNADDAAKYKDDPNFKAQVDSAAGKLTGVDQFIAQRLLSSTAQTGQPPASDDVVSALMDSRRSNITKGEAIEDIQKAMAVLQSPNASQQDKDLLKELQSGSSQNPAAKILIDMANKVGGDDAKELLSEGSLSLNRQWDIGMDKSYVLSQLVGKGSVPPDFANKLSADERELAQHVATTQPEKDQSGKPLTQPGQINAVDLARLVAIEDPKENSTLTTQLEQRLTKMDSNTKVDLFKNYVDTYHEVISVDVLAKVSEDQKQNVRDALSLTKVDAQTDLAANLERGVTFDGDLESDDQSGLHGFEAVQQFMQVVGDSTAGVYKNLTPEQLERLNTTLCDAQDKYDEARKKYGEDHPGFWHQAIDIAVDCAIVTAAMAVATVCTIGTGGLAAASFVAAGAIAYGLMEETKTIVENEIDGKGNEWGQVWKGFITDTVTGVVVVGSGGALGKVAGKLSQGVINSTVSKILGKGVNNASERIVGDVLAETSANGVTNSTRKAIIEATKSYLNGALEGQSNKALSENLTKNLTEILTEQVGKERAGQLVKELAPKLLDSLGVRRLASSLYSSVGRPVEDQLLQNVIFTSANIGLAPVEAVIGGNPWLGTKQWNDWSSLGSQLDQSFHQSISKEGLLKSYFIGLAQGTGMHAGTKLKNELTERKYRDSTELANSPELRDTLSSQSDAAKKLVEDASNPEVAKRLVSRSDIVDILANNQKLTESLAKAINNKNPQAALEVANHADLPRILKSSPEVSTALCKATERSPDVAASLAHRPDLVVLLKDNPDLSNAFKSAITNDQKIGDAAAWVSTTGTGRNPKQVAEALASNPKLAEVLYGNTEFPPHPELTKALTDAVKTDNKVPTSVTDKLPTWLTSNHDVATALARNSDFPRILNESPSLAEPMLNAIKNRPEVSASLVRNSDFSTVLSEHPDLSFVNSIKSNPDVALAMIGRSDLTTAILQSRPEFLKPLTDSVINSKDVASALSNRADLPAVLQSYSQLIKPLSESVQNNPKVAEALASHTDVAALVNNSKTQDLAVALAKSVENDVNVAKALISHGDIVNVLQNQKLAEAVANAAKNSDVAQALFTHQPPSTVAALVGNSTNLAANLPPKQLTTYLAKVMSQDPSIAVRLAVNEHVSPYLAKVIESNPAIAIKMSENPQLTGTLATILQRSPEQISSLVKSPEGSATLARIISDNPEFAQNLLSAHPEFIKEFDTVIKANPNLARTIADTGEFKTVFSTISKSDPLLAQFIRSQASSGASVTAVTPIVQPTPSVVLARSSSVKSESAGEFSHLPGAKNPILSDAVLNEASKQSVTVNNAEKSPQSPLGTPRGLSSTESGTPVKTKTSDGDGGNGTVLPPGSEKPVKLKRTGDESRSTSDPNQASQTGSSSSQRQAGQAGQNTPGHSEANENRLSQDPSNASGHQDPSADPSNQVDPASSKNDPATDPSSSKKSDPKAANEPTPTVAKTDVAREGEQPSTRSEAEFERAALDTLKNYDGETLKLLESIVKGEHSGDGFTLQEALLFANEAIRPSDLKVFKQVISGRGPVAKSLLEALTRKENPIDILQAQNALLRIQQLIGNETQHDIAHEMNLVHFLQKNVPDLVEFSINRIRERLGDSDRALESYLTMVNVFEKSADFSRSANALSRLLEGERISAEDAGELAQWRSIEGLQDVVKLVDSKIEASDSAANKILADATKRLAATNRPEVDFVGEIKQLKTILDRGKVGEQITREDAKSLDRLTAEEAKSFVRWKNELPEFAALAKEIISERGDTSTILLNHLAKETDANSKVLKLFDDVSDLLNHVDKFGKSTSERMTHEEGILLTKLATFTQPLESLARTAIRSRTGTAGDTAKIALEAFDHGLKPNYLSDLSSILNHKGEGDLKAYESQVIDALSRIKNENKNDESHLALEKILGRVLDALSAPSRKMPDLNSMFESSKLAETQKEAILAKMHHFTEAALFRQEIAVKLAHDCVVGSLKPHNVTQRLRNWEYGEGLHALIIEHYTNSRTRDIPLTKGELIRLTDRARERSRELDIERKASATKNRELADQHIAEIKEEVQDIAKRFTERNSQANPVELSSRDFALLHQYAALHIMRDIPPDRNIVLLGRDCWAIDAILRDRGYKSQYFLWSRLQLAGDKIRTPEAWLKEVPPNSIVIDTGYEGSIFNAIRAIDKTIQIGDYFMLHSDSPGTYGQLLPKELGSSDSTTSNTRLKDLSQQVANAIEFLPKLQARTRAMSERLGHEFALEDSRDTGDTPNARQLGTRRAVVRLNAEMLQEAGLSPWMRWKFKEFTGGSPADRLGIGNVEALQKRYAEINEQRNNQNNPDFRQGSNSAPAPVTRPTNTNRGDSAASAQHRSVQERGDMQQSPSSSDRVRPQSFEHFLALLQSGQLTARDIARSISPKNKLGEGYSNEVFRLNDDFVLRVPKSRGKSALDLNQAQFSQVFDYLPHGNVGQPIARIGDVEVLKSVDGKAVADRFPQEARSTSRKVIEFVLRRSPTSKNIRSVRDASEMSQKAFDDLAALLVDLQHSSHYADVRNPGNLLIDKNAQRFNLVDIGEQPLRLPNGTIDLMADGRTIYGMLRVLTGSGVREWVPSVGKLSSEYAAIVEKTVIAAERAGLPISPSRELQGIFIAAKIPEKYTELMQRHGWGVERSSSHLRSEVSSRNVVELLSRDNEFLSEFRREGRNLLNWAKSGDAVANSLFNQFYRFVMDPHSEPHAIAEMFDAFYRPIHDGGSLSSGTWSRVFPESVRLFQQRLEHQFGNQTQHGPLATNPELPLTKNVGSSAAGSTRDFIRNGESSYAPLPNGTEIRAVDTTIGADGKPLSNSSLSDKRIIDYDLHDSTTQNTFHKWAQEFGSISDQHAFYTKLAQKLEDMPGGKELTPESLQELRSEYAASGNRQSLGDLLNRLEGKQPPLTCLEKTVLFKAFADYISEKTGTTLNAKIVLGAGEAPEGYNLQKWRVDHAWIEVLLPQQENSRVFDAQHGIFGKMHRELHPELVRLSWKDSLQLNANGLPTAPPVAPLGFSTHNYVDPTSVAPSVQNPSTRVGTSVADDHIESPLNRPRNNADKQSDVRGPSPEEIVKNPTNFDLFRRAKDPKDVDESRLAKLRELAKGKFWSLGNKKEAFRFRDNVLQRMPIRIARSDSELRPFLLDGNHRLSLAQKYHIDEASIYVADAMGNQLFKIDPSSGKERELTVKDLRDEAIEKAKAFLLQREAGDFTPLTHAEVELRTKVAEIVRKFTEGEVRHENFDSMLSEFTEADRSLAAEFLALGKTASSDPVMRHSMRDIIEQLHQQGVNIADLKYFYSLSPASAGDAIAYMARKSANFDLGIHSLEYVLHDIARGGFKNEPIVLFDNLTKATAEQKDLLMKLAEAGYQIKIVDTSVFSEGINFVDFKQGHFEDKLHDLTAEAQSVKKQNPSWSNSQIVHDVLSGQQRTILSTLQRQLEYIGARGSVKLIEPKVNANLGRLTPEKVSEYLNHRYPDISERQAAASILADISQYYPLSKFAEDHVDLREALLSHLGERIVREEGGDEAVKRATTEELLKAGLSAEKRLLYVVGVDGGQSGYRAGSSGSFHAHVHRTANNIPADRFISERALREKQEAGELPEDTIVVYLDDTPAEGVQVRKRLDEDLSSYADVIVATLGAYDRFARNFETETPAGKRALVSLVNHMPLKSVHYANGIKQLEGRLREASSEAEVTKLKEQIADFQRKLDLLNKDGWETYSISSYQLYTYFTQDNATRAVVDFGKFLGVPNPNHAVGLAKPSAPPVTPTPSVQIGAKAIESIKADIANGGNRPTFSAEELAYLDTLSYIQPGSGTPTPGIVTQRQAQILYFLHDTSKNNPGNAQFKEIYEKYAGSITTNVVSRIVTDAVLSGHLNYPFAYAEVLSKILSEAGKPNQSANKITSEDAALLIELQRDSQTVPNDQIAKLVELVKMCLSTRSNGHLLIDSLRVLRSDDVEHLDDLLNLRFPDKNIGSHEANVYLKLLESFESYQPISLELKRKAQEALSKRPAGKEIVTALEQRVIAQFEVEALSSIVLGRSALTEVGGRSKEIEADSVSLEESLLLTRLLTRLAYDQVNGRAVDTNDPTGQWANYVQVQLRNRGPVANVIAQALTYGHIRPGQVSALKEVLTSKYYIQPAAGTKQLFTVDAAALLFEHSIQASPLRTDVETYLRRQYQGNEIVDLLLMGEISPEQAARTNTLLVNPPNTKSVTNQDLNLLLAFRRDSALFGKVQDVLSRRSDEARSIIEGLNSPDREWLPTIALTQKSEFEIATREQQALIDKSVHLLLDKLNEGRAEALPLNRKIPHFDRETYEKLINDVLADIPSRDLPLQRKLAESIIDRSLYNLTDKGLWEQAQMIHAQLVQILGPTRSRSFISVRGDSFGNILSYLVKRCSDSDTLTVSLNDVVQKGADGELHSVFNIANRDYAEPLFLFEDLSRLTESDRARIDFLKHIGFKVHPIDIASFNKGLNIFDVHGDYAATKQKLKNLLAEAEKLDANLSAEKKARVLLMGDQIATAHQLGLEPVVSTTDMPPHNLFSRTTYGALNDFLLSKYATVSDRIQAIKFLSTRPEIITFDGMIDSSLDFPELIRMTLGLKKLEQQEGKRFADEHGVLQYALLKNSGHADPLMEIERLGAECERNALYVTGVIDKTGYGENQISANSSDGFITALIANANGIPSERIVTFHQLTAMREAGLLKEQSLVILDDVSYSGSQLADAQTKMSNYFPQNELIFANFGIYENAMTRLRSGGQSARNVVALSGKYPLRANNLREILAQPRTTPLPETRVQEFEREAEFLAGGEKSNKYVFDNLYSQLLLPHMASDTSHPTMAQFSEFLFSNTHEVESRTTDYHSAEAIGETYRYSKLGETSLEPLPTNFTSIAPDVHFDSFGRPLEGTGSDKRRTIFDYNNHDVQVFLGDVVNKIGLPKKIETAGEYRSYIESIGHYLEAKFKPSNESLDSIEQVSLARSEAGHTQYLSELIAKKNGLVCYEISLVAMAIARRLELPAKLVRGSSSAPYMNGERWAVDIDHAWVEFAIPENFREFRDQRHLVLDASKGILGLTHRELSADSIRMSQTEAFGLRGINRLQPNDKPELRSSPTPTPTSAQKSSLKLDRPELGSPVRSQSLQARLNARISNSQTIRADLENSNNWVEVGNQIMKGGSGTKDLRWGTLHYSDGSTRRIVIHVEDIDAVRLERNEPPQIGERYRKELAAADLSQHLFGTYPAIARRVIEIEGIGSRDVWIQDAELLPKPNKLDDVEHEYPSEIAMDLQDFIDLEGNPEEYPRLQENLEDALLERIIFGDDDVKYENLTVDISNPEFNVYNIDADRHFGLHEDPALRKNGDASGAVRLARIFAGKPVNSERLAKIEQFYKKFSSEPKLLEDMGLLREEANAVLVRAERLLNTEHSEKLSTSHAKLKIERRAVETPKDGTELQAQVEWSTLQNDWLALKNRLPQLGQAEALSRMEEMADRTAGAIKASDKQAAGMLAELFEHMSKLDDVPHALMVDKLVEIVSEKQIQFSRETAESILSEFGKFCSKENADVSALFESASDKFRQTQINNVFQEQNLLARQQTRAFAAHGEVSTPLNDGFIVTARDTQFDSHDYIVPNSSHSDQRQLVVDLSNKAILEALEHLKNKAVAGERFKDKFEADFSTFFATSLEHLRTQATDSHELDLKITEHNKRIDKFAEWFGRVTETIRQEYYPDPVREQIKSLHVEQALTGENAKQKLSTLLERKELSCLGLSTVVKLAADYLGVPASLVRGAHEGVLIKGGQSNAALDHAWTEVPVPGKIVRDRHDNWIQPDGRLIFDAEQGVYGLTFREIAKSDSSKLRLSKAEVVELFRSGESEENPLIDLPELGNLPTVHLAIRNNQSRVSSSQLNSQALKSEIASKEFLPPLKKNEMPSLFADGSGYASLENGFLFRSADGHFYTVVDTAAGLVRQYSTAGKKLNDFSLSERDSLHLVRETAFTPTIVKIAFDEPRNSLHLNNKLDVLRQKKVSALKINTNGKITEEFLLDSYRTFEILPSGETLERTAVKSASRETLTCPDGSKIVTKIHKGMAETSDFVIREIAKEIYSPDGKLAATIDWHSNYPDLIHYVRENGDFETFSRAGRDSDLTDRVDRRNLVELAKVNHGNGRSSSFFSDGSVAITVLSAPEHYAVHPLTDEPLLLVRKTEIFDIDDTLTQTIERFANGDKVHRIPGGLTVVKYKQRTNGANATSKNSPERSVISRDGLLTHHYDDGSTSTSYSNMTVREAPGHTTISFVDGSGLEFMLSHDAVSTRATDRNGLVANYRNGVLLDGVGSETMPSFVLAKTKLNNGTSIEWRANGDKVENRKNKQIVTELTGHTYVENKFGLVEDNASDRSRVFRSNGDRYAWTADGLEVRTYRNGVTETIDHRTDMKELEQKLAETFNAPQFKKGEFEALTNLFSTAEKQSLAATLLRRSLPYMSDFSMITHLQSLSENLEQTVNDTRPSHKRDPRVYRLSVDGDIISYAARKYAGVKGNLFDLTALPAAGHQTNEPIILSGNLEHLSDEQIEKLRELHEASHSIYLLGVDNFSNSINFVDRATGKVAEKLSQLVERGSALRAADSSLTNDAVADKLLNGDRDALAESIGITICRAEQLLPEELFAGVSKERVKEHLERTYPLYPNRLAAARMLDSDMAYHDLQTIARQSLELHEQILLELGRRASRNEFPDNSQPTILSVERFKKTAVSNNREKLLAAGREAHKDIYYVSGLENSGRDGASSDAFVSGVYQLANRLNEEQFLTYSEYKRLNASGALAGKTIISLDDASYSGAQALDILDVMTRSHDSFILANFASYRSLFESLAARNAKPGISFVTLARPSDSEETVAAYNKLLKELEHRITEVSSDQQTNLLRIRADLIQQRRFLQSFSKVGWNEDATFDVFATMTSDTSFMAVSEAAAELAGIPSPLIFNLPENPFRQRDAQNSEE